MKKDSCEKISKKISQEFSGPPQTNKNPCDPKSPPKIYELIEVLQDPCDSESITVIKDTFVEDVIDSSTGSRQSLSNRYKYCREVISPIVKPESSFFPERSEHKTVVPDCQDSNSFEELSDFKNFNEVYTNADTKNVDNTTVGCVKLDSNNPCETKNVRDPCGKKCSTTTIEEKCRKNKKSPCPSYINPCPPKCSTSKSSTDSCQLKKSNCCEQPKSCESDTPPEVDKCKLKDCISKCVKESQKEINNAKCKPVIGIKEPECPDGKPTYFLLEKSKETLSLSNGDRKSSVQEVFDAPITTLNSIMGTVQSYMCVAYQKTKNAVSYISNGSSETSNERHGKCDVTRKDSKPCAFSEQVKEVRDLNNYNSNGVVQSADNIFQDEASRVESSSSYVSDYGINKFLKNYGDSKFNKSSPYDIPIHSLPDADDYQTPDTSSVFETIKSKIYSFFQDPVDESENEESDEA